MIQFFSFLVYLNMKLIPLYKDEAEIS